MKKIKFSRIGGLSPVIQDGYTQNPNEIDYHTPPARKGLYAFIYPHFESFLLSGKWSRIGEKNKYEKFEYLKDKDGNKIKLYERNFNPDCLYDEPPINPLLKKHIVKNKKSDNNNIEISKKFWTEIIRNENGDYINSYLIKMKKMKIFEHNGELWHHLKNKAVKDFEIIDEVGYWIKTDYDVFVRAYEQDKIDCVEKLLREKKGFDRLQINTKNVYNFIVKDHLEVFIERIKNNGK